jgi:hypothetical protein
MSFPSTHGVAVVDIILLAVCSLLLLLAFELSWLSCGGMLRILHLILGPVYLVAGVVHG